MKTITTIFFLFILCFNGISQPDEPYSNYLGDNGNSQNANSNTKDSDDYLPFGYMNLETGYQLSSPLRFMSGKMNPVNSWYLKYDFCLGRNFLLTTNFSMGGYGHTSTKVTRPLASTVNVTTWASYYNKMSNMYIGAKYIVNTHGAVRPFVEAGMGASFLETAVYFSDETVNRSNYGNTTTYSNSIKHELKFDNGGYAYAGLGIMGMFEFEGDGGIAINLSAGLVDGDYVQFWNVNRNRNTIQKNYEAPLSFFQLQFGISVWGILDR